VKTLAIGLNLIIFLCLVCTCGPTARENAIKGALITVNTARDELLIFDGPHQSDLVNNATSLEDGQNKLDTYRKKREHVRALLAEAYRAIAIAVVVNSDQDAVAKILTTVKIAIDAVHELKGASSP
jgi:beta-phosphoglucomutase-like phosphatase (HAD superfamily)